MIDRQKTQEYEKRNKAVWTSDHKKCFYGGSLFLLLLFITSCKSNQFLIDSNEVENVNFWFIGDVDTDVPITDCLTLYLEMIAIKQLFVIGRLSIAF